MGAGSDDVGVFGIDTDELDAVIADLEACERRLETLTDDVEEEARELQSVWEGLAAQAQHEAQQEWTEGMRAMRAALADLRAAARLAHGNYSGAAAANLSMWQEVS